MAKKGGLPIPLLIGGAAVAALALGRRRGGGASSGVGGNPVWPLQNNFDRLVPEKKVYWHGRAFGVDRGTGSGKYHAGIDLAAKWGDPVLATEDGTIVATQGWDGPNAKALLLETDSGVVALYGAIAPNSWKKFGLGVGSRVQRGQPIAFVGEYPHGSQMLHFELYTQGTRKNERYFIGREPPPNLLDPTNYLKRAAGIAVV